MEETRPDQTLATVTSIFYPYCMGNEKDTAHKIESVKALIAPYNTNTYAKILRNNCFRIRKCCAWFDDGVL